MFDSLTNRAEFFSDHYLDARLTTDLAGLRAAWSEAEGRGEHTARMGLRSLPKHFFQTKADAVEATRATRADAVRDLNDLMLAALGFTPRRKELVFDRNGGTDQLTATVATSVESATGLLLVAIDAGLATEVDELFDDTEAPAGTTSAATTPAGLLLDPMFQDSGKHAIHTVADAPGALFSLDEPPRYVLVLAGAVLLLAERSKWAEGRFLAVDLDAALGRADVSAKGELESIAALFSADSLIPGHLDVYPDATVSATSVLDQLTENSQKHAVGVSKELREGMRRSIEILANEVIEQRLAKSRHQHKTRYAGDQVDPRELTTQCLRYLYRLIVLLYAESRPELGVLPVDDDAYLEGYSLDRLRELVLVDLESDRSRNGTHFSESLQVLFDLVNDGYHGDDGAGAAREQRLIFDDEGATAVQAPERSTEEYLKISALDATIFDPGATPLLDGVELRNHAIQQVLSLLMLNREGKGRDDQRGFISYAQLGINQLGAVYEGLMAYSGFFATDDLYEVARGGDPSDGTWMVPFDEADEYPDEVFVTHTDPLTNTTERVRHPKGSFVFRLAGRDRQRSASYYTPEVLTQCVVRHALAELLGTDDWAREPGGSAGITEAREILDLTVCEPALGSGAFANEAINQLSAEYLKRRQAELGETLDAESYTTELQKVKAHFALHQVYGVDLNPTAVELAEVSLWLNSMHPGLKAPWFGLNLRSGNSLVGARRATWRTKNLKGRVWARKRDTAKTKVLPPTDRPLAEPLDADEIHHFLLPGHGWGAVADRKEARELAPKAVESLKAWRKTILAAPSTKDAERLTGLAAGVERLWVEATEMIERVRADMRRPLELYGIEDQDTHLPGDRHVAERLMHNPDSSLSRLRLVMDAWVGLWFWPVDPDLDRPGTDPDNITDEETNDDTDAPTDALTKDTRPPTWDQWLTALEAIIGPEPAVPLGQLDMFADLDAIAEQEKERARGRVPIQRILDNHPWLKRVESLARREGAWHWELEFAPVFQSGGFDLQVGNPPWVRPTWKDDLTLAEFDPWWGITDKAPESTRKQRREHVLANENNRRAYLLEVASHEGLNETLSSPQLRPVLSGIQTNLYMSFMDTTWRHANDSGIVGLLHPVSHFVDPKAGRLRQECYGRLRRLWQFANELILFEDVDHHTEFSVSVTGSYDLPVVINVLENVHHEFLYLSNAKQPQTVDASLVHDGSGEVPGIQLPAGGWDLRPHRDRLVAIDRDVLADWARLFDEPGTPPQQARLLRPVTRQDLDALSVLADQPVRLADHEYQWTAGWHEKSAKTDGFIEWRTDIPTSWDEVILQGPHFTVATPFAKQPNENCKHNQDYSDWDLETLLELVVPRTNYQRACDRDTYDANLPHWNGRPATEYWRLGWRAMTQSGLERSLHASLIPHGTTHIGSAFSLTAESTAGTAKASGLWSSIPVDFLVKISGTANVKEFIVRRFPLPHSHPLDSALLLRTLRLNCLTADYTPLWEELFDPAWTNDSWTTEPDSPWNGILGRVPLGDVEPKWSMDTPLRRDAERRMALVELDAIAAIVLGLSAEQLCAMYRTQFAVLRKYEYAMAFDAEGRKICKHHQSAGYRQAQLQEQAKAGDLPKEWRSIWSMVEAWEEDPSSVDFGGHFTPPFTRVDREAEMTRAYEEFTLRLDSAV